MAMVYLLREGFGPDSITFSKELPLNSIEQVLASYPNEYCGNNMPTLETDRQDLTVFRDPSFVVIKIDKTETNETFSKDGYYIYCGVMQSDMGKLTK